MFRMSGLRSLALSRLQQFPSRFKPCQIMGSASWKGLSRLVPAPGPASVLSYFAFTPNVNPTPVVKSTSFFLLPSTGWLL